MSKRGTRAGLREPDDREDVELVLAVKHGDNGAFDVLYRRHAEKAHRAASRWSARSVEREDIVSESFGRLLAILKNGGGPQGDFFPYLLRVIHNVAVDRARQDRFVEPHENLDLVVVTSESTVDPVILAWQHENLANAFSSLSVRWQEVLWYVEVEGMRPAAVAKKMNISANAVAALAYRARQRLRQAYLEMCAEGEDVARKQLAA